ncbi:small integral membrane protein 30-like [Siniperca chuatsi]|uniref:small integral membrane protein 30-like n=1 Tax=Siniperca chuatsi TaxID=119488 RepID=UPI001CE1BFD5|nr:small integral membrane protein 30-like [Siniperca chuatsi]
MSSDSDAGAQAPRKSTATAEKLNMAPKLELPNAAAVVWLMFLALIPPVEAYDAGDALALLLGTILTVVGFCAFLGWYARRRNGQL